MSKKSKPSSSSAKKAEPKPETKSKPESSTPADNVEAEKEEPESVPEPVSGSATDVLPQPSLERTYVPLVQGQTNPESLLPNESSLYPTSYAGGVVTTVTVSGKDPRTAMSTSTVSAAAAAGASVLYPTPEKVSIGESNPPPKSILTKPSASSDPRYLTVPPSPNVRYVYITLQAGY